MSRSLELRLDYAGCVLRACCDDLADLAWLRDFLCPWFQALPDAGQQALPDAGRVVAEVALSRDAAAFARLRAAGPEPGAAPLPAFLADGAALTLQRWTGQAGAQRFYDAGADAFLETPEPGVWRVVAAPGAHFARVAWMRVLRELATLQLAGQGAALLHAAALELHGEALAFVGPKRSGKTSGLLFALGAPDARFVANDRLCSWAAQPALVRGMPTIVNLRGDALAAFPQLAQRVRDADPHVATRPGESHAGQPEWPRRAGSVGLGSAAFLAAAGVSACAQAPLGVVVFPHVSGRPGGFSVTRLAPDETLRRLRAADLLAHAPRGGPFAPHGEPQRADAGGCLARLAEQVRGVECQLGLEAYSGDPGKFTDAIRTAAA